MLVRPRGNSSFEMAVILLVRVSTYNGNTHMLYVSQYSEILDWLIISLYWNNLILENIDILNTPNRLARSTSRDNFLSILFQ